jgi:hypothetical protein
MHFFQLLNQNNDLHVWYQLYAITGNLTSYFLISYIANKRTSVARISKMVAAVKPLNKDPEIMCRNTFSEDIQLQLGLLLCTMSNN